MAVDVVVGEHGRTPRYGVTMGARAVQRYMETVEGQPEPVILTAKAQLDEGRVLTTG